MEGPPAAHLTLDGGPTDPRGLVLEGFRFHSVLFQSKSTAVLEWDMDLGEGQHVPIVAKIGVDKRRLNREFALARQCAGLTPDPVARLRAWAQSVEAAKETRIIAPFARCELPSGQLVVLSPKIGDAVDCRARRRPFTPRQAVQIARDVAVGLGHCHAANCIHLDVKPANMIVDDTGRAFLIEFSLARVRMRNGISARSGLGGTPAYMAPEQTGRLTEPTSFPADLYSLGASMYELVSGVLPFPRSVFSTTSEMVYAQVAKSPPPLSEDIPPLLRSVISTLMNKDTAQRYSSARALVDDLDRLLAEGFEAPTFCLDANPTIMALRPLDRLYGCDAQVSQVQAAFKLLPKKLSTSLFVTVSGPAGAGKSCLIQHISRQRNLGALLCSGKYLQFEKVPYGAVRECFRRLVKRLRSLPAEKKSSLFGHIAANSALLANAKQLSSIIPEFYTLVRHVFASPSSASGRPEYTARPPPHSTPSNAAEDSARYTEAFVQVFDFFYNVACLPVVLFLDDLQWADDCSLRLIHALLLNERTSILLLGGYRSNEVAPADPLGVMLTKLKAAHDRVHVTDVILCPWSQEVVEDVLAFMMDSRGNGYSPAELRHLASRVKRSTGGNPFFTTEFIHSLVKDKLLRYSWNARRWTWSPDDLNSERFSDNVVAVIANSLQDLPTETQKALAALATAGLPCPLGLLRDCLPLSARSVDPREFSSEDQDDPDVAWKSEAGLSLEERSHSHVLPALRPALDMGMIALEGPPSDRSTVVRFSHDEIERSSKDLVTDAHCLRLEVAAAIARWLGLPVLAHLGDMWKENTSWTSKEHEGLPNPHELCFVMLNLFVEERDQILGNREAVQLMADLTAQAAAVAVQSLAYEHAVLLYKSSVRFEDSLLGDTVSWHDCESSAKLWKLRKDLGSALVLSRLRGEAREVLRECSSHAKTDVQRLEALHLLAKLAREMESYDEAINYGIKSAALLGVVVNKNVTFEESFEKATELVLKPLEAASGSLQALLPEVCADYNTILCDDVLDNMVPSAFCSGNIALHALIPAITLGRAIKRGSCTTGTAALITVMGFNLCGIYGLRKEGWALAKQGLALYERYLEENNWTPDPRIYVGAALAHPWGGIPRDCYQWLDTAFSYAYRLGNFGYCGYTRTISLWAHMMYGDSLGEILQLYSERNHFVETCGLLDMTTSMKGVALAARLLVGGKLRPPPGELASLELEAEERCAFAKLSCVTWIALAYQILGRSLDAKRLYRKVTDEWKEGTSGMAPHLDFFWVEGVLCASWLRSIRSLGARQASPWLAALRRSVKELKSMALACSSNWEAKHLLVRAHYLSVKSLDPSQGISPLQPLQAFEEAAQKGDAASMPHIAALAYLGAADCCTKSLGLAVAKRGYLSAASSRLEAWGARQVASELATATGLREFKKYSSPVAGFQASSRAGRASLAGSIVSPPPGLVSSPSSDQTSSGGYEDKIESEAIARASSVISSKISIREVILAFVDIIEQTAGAQKIVLMLKKPEDLSKASEPLASLLASWADIEPSSPRLPTDPLTCRRNSAPSSEPSEHRAIGQESSPSSPMLTLSGHHKAENAATALMRISDKHRPRSATALSNASPENRRPARRTASAQEVHSFCETFSVEAFKQEGVLSIGASPLSLDVAPLQLLLKSRNLCAPVIVTDALSDVESTGADGAYYCLHKVRSALAVPVPYQDEVYGMIYLENNQVAGVFHSKTAAVVSMLCAQLGISVQNARLYEHLKERQHALEETNRRMAAAHAASTRFVPEPFLRRVGRANTMEVCLGDAVETNLTILFADLRSFTSVSEKMDAKSVFRFLNRLLAVVVPAIAQNGGSVDKFLGDGTLSLFSRASDALSAARAIQAAVRQLNSRNDCDRFGNAWPQVKLGVGIHTGNTILGCLGTNTRLDATVVGDAVNLASRVESLTKGMAVDILATGATLDDTFGGSGACAAGKADYAPLLRNMGEVLVEGKEKPTLVFQVFEDPVELAKESAGKELAAAVHVMLDTREEFYEGLSLHKKGEYHAAHEIFAALSTRCPLDTAARARALWAVQAGAVGRARAPPSPMRYCKDGTMAF